MIKEGVLKKILNLSTIVFVLLVLSVSSYFIIESNTRINSVKFLANSISNSDDISVTISAIHDGLGKVFNLFLLHLLSSLLVIIFLIILCWTCFQYYLISKKEALVDNLTQTYNKKAIIFGLKKEIKRATRYKHSLSIAFLDIDHFKKYNDGNGHVAGEKALKKFSQILKNQVREIDYVGRYGGEEFLIIFPETSLKDARKVCERIRKEVEKTYFPGEHKLPDKKLTTSVGLVQIKNYTKANSFIHGADINLYKAKTSGRNKVV